MSPKKTLLFLGLVCVSVLHAQSHCDEPIIIGGGATLCAGNNTGFVFVDNSTDSLTIIRWEFSVAGGSFLPMADSIRDTLHFANLMQTVHYRAHVQRRGCFPTFTAHVTVSVDQPSIAGNILGATSACAVLASGNLVLTEQRGQVIAWQRQETGQSDWVDFGTTLTSQPISNVTETILFRAVVQNGVCPATTTIPVSVIIHPNPIASFDFQPVCLGDAVYFFDRSTISSGSISSRQWIMGDGATSTDINPSRRYLQAGTYSVTLSVISNQNCRHDTTKQVEIFHLPIANFSASEVCLNDSTVFSNLSSSLSGEITLWEWDFPNLIFSAEREPKHLFTQVGEHQVRLFVTTEHGCRHSVQRMVRVNENPVAMFVADTVCLGEPTSFYNRSSIVNGFIQRHQWNFGDGATSMQAHPFRTYLTSGEFLVQLIVETERQCRDTTSQLIRVNALPIADFSANEACDGETTFFQNLSTSTDAPIVHFLWNFGDGSVSNDSEPSRLYLNPETYTVTLQVRCENGCQHQTQRQIIVHRNPIADFFVQNVCVGDRAEFVNQSFIRSNESLYYHWSLGDGTETQLSNFFHTYEYSGSYTVFLRVTSSRGGCVDSIQRTLRIHPLPNINAGEDLTTGRGVPVQLSVSGGISYRWTPTTGLNSSISVNPIATLNSDQTYIVFGTDAFGCENSDTITVFVIDDQRIVPTNFVSPNSDGGNQFWVIHNIENYPEAQITIFDLNGTVVYSTTNYQNNWDGRNRNGEILPDGTYYFVITFPDGGRVYRGAILVLRRR